MGKDNIQSEIIVNKTGDGIVYKTNKSQRFDYEDFLDVYNDTVRSIENIKDNIEQIEEKIATTLEEKEDAMDVIHYMVESEPQDEIKVVEEDCLTLDDLNAYLQLQQQKQQKEQSQQRLNNLLDQKEEMQSAAEQIAEENDKEIEELED